MQLYNIKCILLFASVNSFIAFLVMPEGCLLTYGFETKDIQTNDISLKPTYVIQSADNLHVGEAVNLQAMIFNHGRETIVLDNLTECNANIQLKLGIFDIHITDKMGVPVRNSLGRIATLYRFAVGRRTSYEEEGGSGEVQIDRYTIEPDKGILLRRTIPLHAWFDLSMPGEYRAYITRDVKVVTGDTYKIISLGETVVEFTIKE